jgi:ubiquinone/menaquinone biosynthesis C-methylase UbiE
MHMPYTLDQRNTTGFRPGGADSIFHSSGSRRFQPDVPARMSGKIDILMGPPTRGEEYMPGSEERYVPALGFGLLTRLYDPVVRFTTRESTFKGALLSAAGLQAGDVVLDVGCGTGTLAISAARAQPAARITGLDGDAEVLAIARRKADAAGMTISFEQALSTRMPFSDGNFTVVLSSLFFHHLQPEDKRVTLAEIHRVLAPGGRLHVADWGRPQNPVMGVAFHAIRLLDGYANTADNVAGRLPRLFAEAGLVAIEHTCDYATIFGTMALYSARRPA